jgi:hypothetical protein
VQVLEENAELTSRLIDVALTSSHNDVFDAAFGDEGTPHAGPLARLPLGHWSQKEVQRRHREATEEVRSHFPTLSFPTLHSLLYFETCRCWT